MPRQNSLQAKIEARIAASADAVFLPREFNDLSGQRQVLRALRKSVASGALIRLGYGVYARAQRSARSGQPMLAAQDGFIGAARQALTKLQVNWEPSVWERAYNEGQSTQVPINPVLRIKGRFCRQLSYRGKSLFVER
jgi:hypothetical protein